MRGRGEEEPAAWQKGWSDDEEEGDVARRRAWRGRGCGEEEGMARRWGWRGGGGGGEEEDDKEGVVRRRAW